MMPLGWPSIAAGTVLAFARAMGEFGCTLFFAGSLGSLARYAGMALGITAASHILYGHCLLYTS